MSLLQEKTDLDWLFEVHLTEYPHLREFTKMAVINGNEDSPDAIVLYQENHVDSIGHVLKLDEQFAKYEPVVSYKEYANMVESLVKSPADIVDSMNPQGANLTHMVMGISGEAGELLDAVKKHVIYNKPLDTANIIEELGDLEFYMEGLRKELGITRDQCLQANMMKLGKRYSSFKYTDKAAIVRADKSEEV